MSSSSPSSSSSGSDVFSWIESLPPIPEWRTTTSTTSFSMVICPSSSHDQPPLKLKLSMQTSDTSCISLSIVADYNHPVFLWTSKKHVLKSKSNNLLDDDELIPMLLYNFVEDFLKYCPNRYIYSLRLSRRYLYENNIKDILNFSFLTLAFVICIYEAPTGIRASCLNRLKDELGSKKSREVCKDLMRLLGSNMEEQWMRCMSLALTNWISEIRGNNPTLRCSCPLFSYAISTLGLWKVQLYCPVIAMYVDKASGPSPDEALLFSLNHHQMEGVIQLNHRVTVQERWIEVKVNTDNIRCDVMKLVTDSVMKERGAGTSEKHFPSRITLQITPTMQSSVISISVSKSSDNPSLEIGSEKGIEASFEPPKAIGFHISATESVSTSVKPWIFEESVFGNTANLHWFLHDSGNGREVFSSRPSKFAMLLPKSWFKHRYSKAHRPFTRQGGVIFAGDEYGASVSWKVDRGRMGSTMDWEIKGWIWLTYWPNKYRTFYTETRRLEFRELVQLTLV